MVVGLCFLFDNMFMYFDLDCLYAYTCRWGEGEGILKA